VEERVGEARVVAERVVDWVVVLEVGWAAAEMEGVGMAVGLEVATEEAGLVVGVRVAVVPVVEYRVVFLAVSGAAV